MMWVFSEWVVRRWVFSDRQKRRPVQTFVSPAYTCCHMTTEALELMTVTQVRSTTV